MEMETGPAAGEAIEEPQVEEVDPETPELTDELGAVADEPSAEAEGSEVEGSEDIAAEPVAEGDEGLAEDDAEDEE